jgi:hypothetical protein
MSLEFTFNHSAEDVFNLFCDPDFLVERSIALGEISADCEVEEDENGTVTIAMRREVKQDLPAFLAKLFNPQQTITMTDEWRLVGNNYVGKGEFLVEGQPVNVKTEMTLKPQGKGCVFSIKYKPTAKIPLVGGKVEKFIQGNCEDGTMKELKYTAEALAK